MDFNRLASGLDSSISKRLAEQLLSNSLFRDAAIKANRAEQEEETERQTAPPPASGLDNLLNALSNALNQAVKTAETPPAAIPTATGFYSAASVQQLLTHPFMQAVLKQLSMEDALGIQVLLGQVDPDVAEAVVGLLNALPASTLRKVESVLRDLTPAQLEKGIAFFQALFTPNEDAIFHQRSNTDVYYNSANILSVTGADLDAFLRLAYQVKQKGQNFEKFLDAGTEVLQKGDYDDFRRFLDVTGLVLLNGEKLEDFYAFGSRILNSSPKDYEANAFQVYMTLAHGGRLQDFIDIASNLETTGFEGRNNLVDLSRIIIDFRNSGAYTPYLFQQMAAEARSEGGNVREFMNNYMQMRGMGSTKPDPRRSQFTRIERIDGEVMVIKQGEKAALFAQAISTLHGLLPESVLYWSSKEQGALMHGSSYLDLSKLGVGVHHIAVKIGGYGGGTDTAIKTVIVEPAEAQTEDMPTDQTVEIASPAPASHSGIVLPQNGQIKITLNQSDAGLRSDLYLRRNGQEELIAENAQKNAGLSITRDYKAGERLDFFIRTHLYNTQYDHGTDTATYGGRSYAQVEQIGENRWRVSFEDLPGQYADWDYNDVSVEIEFVPASADSADSVQASELAIIPYSPQTALQLTRDALSALQTGGASAFAEYAALLNQRYYKALDALIEYNQDYMRHLIEAMVERAEEDAEQEAALQALLQHILTKLTGEEGSAEQSSAAEEVVVQSPPAPELVVQEPVAPGPAPVPTPTPVQDPAVPNSAPASPPPPPSETTPTPPTIIRRGGYR